MIPRLIHQFWSGPPLPDVYRQRSEALEALNPGWTVHRWSDASLGPLANATLFRSPRAWSPRPDVLRAVVARFELLWHFGGLWVDYDLTPYRSFDLLPDVDLVVGSNGQNPDIAVLGATPHHWFIERLIAAAADAPRRPHTGFCPGIHMLLAALDGVDVPLFPRGAFYPHSCDPLDAAFCGDPVYLARPCPPTTVAV